MDRADSFIDGISHEKW